MPPRTKLLAEAAGAVAPPPATLPAVAAAPAGAAAAPVKPAVATAAATGAATGAAVAQRRRETPVQREAKAAEQKAAADTWLQEEAQKAQRRKEALEAVGRIRDLQRAGQIGETTIGGDEFGAVTRYPSMQSMTISASARPTIFGQSPGRPGRTIAPTQTPKSLTQAELATKTRDELVDDALRVADAFSKAAGEYAAGAEEIGRKVQSGVVAPTDMPGMASHQRARLQDVLNLAAQMREYGYVGTNEELLERFRPK